MLATASSNSTKKYELAPKGKQLAVLADAVDLGMVTTTFNGEEKTQHKIRLIWLTKARDSKGQPFRLFQRVTLSSHPKSQLYQIVTDATGREPDGDIETEDLIGTVAEVYVVHQPSADGKRTFANIKSMMPSDAELPIPKDFVRGGSKREEVPPPTDDDNPFGDGR